MCVRMWVRHSVLCSDVWKTWVRMGQDMELYGSWIDLCPTLLSLQPHLYHSPKLGIPLEDVLNIL